MTQEFKDSWIKALTSGNYLQVKGTLKGETPEGNIGYCCLGVFCSIIGREPPMELEDSDGDVSEGPVDLYKYCKRLIPEDIAEQGVEMNDDGSTFDEIADMIQNFWVIPQETSRKE